MIVTNLQLITNLNDKLIITAAKLRLTVGAF